MCSKTPCYSMSILMPWLHCPTPAALQTWCHKVLVMGRFEAAAAWGGVISSLIFFSSLADCCSCLLPITPSSLVWKWRRAVVGMGLYWWDLLGDMCCKDNGIHHLCIPGDKDTTALCGWRREMISCLSLQNTLFLPPPFRSHPALTGCWQLTGMGAPLPQGKRVSDPRKKWLGLKAAASTGSKGTGGSKESMCSLLPASHPWPPILCQDGQILWLLAWFFSIPSPALGSKGCKEIFDCLYGAGLPLPCIAFCFHKPLWFNRGLLKLKNYPALNLK